ncbi:hypothetical protein H1V43_33675 [Streptomyces sp. PSKA54]|uniref:Uncharacterized protein n=1 Tax=Streptomyces himalayensis subsp. aureolus TaxID=2758039 RepID=A0A7W2HJU3_9ACTN|nr:hypothetical protein [Streptomyces himalayensis]MBA4866189.1 hypothetical protein [Streptomyces himalayensis subsp. aureolus]
MTTTGDSHANSAGFCSTRSSAELVHVPMPPEFLAALVHSSGVSVEGLLQELRGDLVLRPPSNAPAPAVPAPEPAIAEKVRTVSLVHATPQQADHGADVVLVQRVDGQLRTLLAQVKWSPHTRERERARLGIFAALDARRAILESRTVDGWKPTVDEFARTWLGIRRADEDWLEAVCTALLGDWVDLLDEVAERGLNHLKKESSTIHRQLQPLFQRKTHGARLLSLDHTTPAGGTLLDLLTDRAAPNQKLPLWEPEDDRVAAVFARLPRHEQDLARTWANAAPGSTWTEFAGLAGVSAADADNFRRKLRRLGRQHTNTHAARRTRSNA